MKIVFASQNSGKIAEIAALLSNVAIEIIPQKHFSIADVPETAATFIENALIKARHACKHSQLPAIADDSGLVVPALKGAPGIYSARFAGENATAEKNNQKLLQAMQAIHGDDRRAYFYCALVFLLHENDPTPIICEGKWWGKMLTAERGQQGFGYDPLFFIPELNKTAAELSRLQKNALSHRGIALQSLIKRLAEKI